MQQPYRPERRKRLYHHDGAVIRLRPGYRNHIWSIDFVHDELSNGRPYKMLTVLDECTWEALGVAVGARVGAADDPEALYPLLPRHGRPDYIRSDNGPEFTAAPYKAWLKRAGAGPLKSRLDAQETRRTAGASLAEKPEPADQLCHAPPGARR